ncbi:glycosyltransferase family 4 protein [Formosa sediminum]|uniref:Glycosyltransferase family 4 protein n=1 Tax=Formosa sediminum TaxID=2594004 RepID=A0A516GQN5_9FLAO|nr:glycosyltransferase family 4 protein [Formosa sediminum]QDO93690.1 glycosyltransferase family 4 protein [Formosa sediminum]
MKKEIIYFLPDSDAGVTSVIRNLLKYREKKDIYYKVILTQLIEKESVHVKHKLDADEQIVFKYSKYENLYAVCRRLKKYITTSKSVLVANDGLELRMVQLLKLKNPLVYIMHGDFRYYYGLIKQNQGIIDRYIVISKVLYTNVLKILKEEDKHRVSLEYFPVPEINQKNKQLKDIDLLFVGSFNERKGVQFLLSIFKGIQKQFPELNFSLIGSGELNHQLREQFSTESNVRFLGQLTGPEVAIKMQQSKILLFPSLAEGLPNVVVEAMKSRCVAVCSDLPSGIPDLIDDKITGFKIPIGDITGFSNIVIELLLNQKKRDEIALNALNKATEMFQPQKNADNYEGLIINTKPYKKLYSNKILGGILNQSYLPNALVKLLRKLELSPKL